MGFERKSDFGDYLGKFDHPVTHMWRSCCKLWGLCSDRLWSGLEWFPAFSGLFSGHVVQQPVKLSFPSLGALVVWWLGGAAPSQQAKPPRVK